MRWNKDKEDEKKKLKRKIIDLLAWLSLFNLSTQKLEKVGFFLSL